MGKVKKLRQKYRALCFKNQAMMKVLGRNHDQKIKIKPGEHDNSNNQKIKTQLKNSNPIRNPCLLRPRHDSIISISNQSIQTAEEHPKVQILKKSTNTYRKGLNKMRHEALIRDLKCFKKTMTEESFMKNAHAMVMNQTMSKLSSEYFEHSKQ